MSGTQGQAAIEVVALMPIVLVSAVGLVELGGIVQQRMVAADAAAHAARAVIEGADPGTAARRVSDDAKVTVDRAAGVVRVQLSRPGGVLGAAGVPAPVSVASVEVRP